MVLTFTALFFACKKNGEHTGGFGADNNSSELDAIAACNFVTLSGNITASTTLSAANVYKLDGCVTVKPGATLTIPAGTVLQGMKTPTAGGESVLVVERGAQLIAVGTSASPIIFTSDQAPGSRAPGDWVGLRVFGRANNNNSNSLPVDLGCAIQIGGGTNNADNSGRLQYVQVNFAGELAGPNDMSQAGIMLNSVGDATMVDHIQVSHSKNDALFAAGGKVKLTNILSYNTDRTDYRVSYGNISNMQFLAALRLNASAIPSANAYGLDISNHPTALSAAPLTKPVISNVSIMGPKYCGAATVSSLYANAIRFFNNGAGEIYNTVATGWNGRGLLIQGPQSVAQTSANNLQFSYNSFHNTATPFAFTGAGTWPASGGCDNTIAAWITGSGTAPCKEAGNQFSVATLGYDGSFCGNYCAAGFSQNFVLGGTTLLAPNFSWDTTSSFAHPNYRGAFGSASWTLGWTDMCSQNTNYCI